MKVMHLISGGDSGGAKTHLFELFDRLTVKCDVTVVCLMKGVFYNEILQKDIKTLLFEQKNRLDLSVVRKIADEIGKLALAHGEKEAVRIYNSSIPTRPPVSEYSAKALGEAQN